MRLYPRTLKWRAVSCGLALGVLCMYLALGTSEGKSLLYRAVQGTPLGDTLYVQYLRDVSDPFHRDLARGHIKAGDSLDELARKYRVEGGTDHGEYRTVGYPGLCITGGSRVVAKNGRLVFASQDFGDHHYTYFNTLTPDELATAETSWHTALDLAHRKWAISHASVLGVAPLARRIHVDSFLTPDDQP